MEFQALCDQTSDIIQQAEIATNQPTRNEPIAYKDVWGEMLPVVGNSSALERLNTRRLMCTIRKEIEMLLEWNDEETHTVFRDQVNEYLEHIKLRGLISNYHVVCDETNNWARIIDENKFVADIYIKPIRSVSYFQLEVTSLNDGTF